MRLIKSYYDDGGKRGFRLIDLGLEGDFRLDDASAEDPDDGGMGG